MNKNMVKSAGIAALAAAVLFTGCSKFNPDTTLVTINTGDGTKDTISLGYANFAARYQQSMYDQYLLSYYGEGMWSTDMTGTGSTMEDDTKEGVLEDIENQYLAKLHASDYDIALTDEQNTAIAEAAAKFMSDNPEETLEVMGATEEYVKQYLEYRTYYSLVSNAAMEEAGESISDEDCWMRTFSYVLFDTTGTTDEEGNAVEYTEEEIADLKAQAEELAAADDYSAKAEELEVTASTYSYLKGEEEDDTMDMAIIEAAEALDEGDTSDVIEIEGVGYYVIHLDADHDEDASQTKKESLESDEFDKLLETWKAAITWTVDEKAWAKVEFDTLFKTLETETEETTDDATTEETTDTEESTEDASEETEVEDTEDTSAEEETEETSAESDESTEETEAE
ncbi:MAG: hypothetical protein E7274_03200 [Pseudobutyrivibrio ruminis]|uniref:peptidylprolyl isomerase n=1 Tax=Pseudobutyrivibrio ruminis TaxID=46206 RepID=UPI0026EB55D5|nr:peptidylprolyl isomerase [Pseudobutyrivibrio ruminis]MBE5913053.1 hypothetical protein [Pseudobutyrivibrio ruminis]